MYTGKKFYMIYLTRHGVYDYHMVFKPFGKGVGKVYKSYAFAKEKAEYLSKVLYDDYQILELTINIERVVEDDV